MFERDPRTLLTPAQVECLRLVHHGSSKKIAQIRGGSHNTVDNHIKAALLRLGLDDRDAAAALVRKWDAREARPTPTSHAAGSQTAPQSQDEAPDLCPAVGHDQNLASPSPPVATQTDTAELDFSREVQDEPTGGTLREVPTRYGDPAVPEPIDQAASSGADDVRLSPFQVLARALALTVALTIVLSAARPIGEGFEALATLILHLRQ